MRKVVLSDSDFNMFDRDLGQDEYDFYCRHKDAFKRMWMEQVLVMEKIPNLRAL